MACCNLVLNLDGIIRNHKNYATLCSNPGSDSDNRSNPHVLQSEEKKIAASSMLHEAKIAYYAFDAAILFVTTIGPAVAKAT